MKIIFIFLLSFQLLAKNEKGEVLENPTLKTLSGSLNRYSFYSNFVYRGGPLSDPAGAERPNLLAEGDKIGLASMSGQFGIKVRLSQTDNISLQSGVYSTTPFHSSINSSDIVNQIDFEENGRKIDVDNPIISYFKTYYIGKIQNVSFLSYQHVTRGSHRDIGWTSGFRFSHALAYRILPFLYVASTINYENLHYDKRTIQKSFQGFEFERSLLDSQDTHRLRANLAAELYLSRKMAFRLITDILSYYWRRAGGGSQTRELAQTLAFTYFVSRDISIAPSIRFIAEDLNDDRTNVGLSFNLNL